MHLNKKTEVGTKLKLLVKNIVNVNKEFLPNFSKPLTELLKLLAICALGSLQNFSCSKASQLLKGTLLFSFPESCHFSCGFQNFGKDFTLKARH